MLAILLAAVYWRVCPLNKMVAGVIILYTEQPYAAHKTKKRNINAGIIKYFYKTD